MLLTTFLSKQWEQDEYQPSTRHVCQKGISGSGLTKNCVCVCVGAGHGPMQCYSGPPAAKIVCVEILALSLKER